jgi:phosphatidylserine decarboxylase
MRMRVEVTPFIIISIAIGALIALLNVAAGTIIGAVLVAYMLYFFRDPKRTIADDPTKILSAADGVIARITEIESDPHVGEDAIRISIFLSLFNVHVNRAPMSGKSRFLGYSPGKRLFTFDEKSSEVNQHNAILLENEHTKCLIKQIVGPVCRRVVYWLDHDNETAVQVGDKFGMMKFGSRLDMTFPKSDIVVTAKLGQKVQAGLSVVAELKGKTQ